MLSHICCDDRVSLCQFIEFLNDHRTGELGFIVKQRVLGLHFRDLFHPLLVAHGRELLVEIVEHIPEVADD